MARWGIALLPWAIAALAVALPRAAAAQIDPLSIPPGPKRVDVSGSGGVLLATDWSNLVLLGSVSPATGTAQQVLARDLSLDPAQVFGAVVTYWEGRYGFRAHAGFGRSCLTLGRTCSEAMRLAGASGAIDVDLWSYDVGGAIGLIDYARGRWVWPYVFVGVGGVTYNLERTVGPPLTFIERRPVAGETVVVTGAPDTLLIAVDELGLETRFAVNLGAGVDFRLPLGPGGVGLRFELSDHVHRSPVEIQVTSLDRFGHTSSVDFGLVHNLRAAAGVVLHFGR